jgi:hypothetical protein
MRKNLSLFEPAHGYLKGIIFYPTWDPSYCSQPIRYLQLNLPHESETSPPDAAKLERKVGPRALFLRSESGETHILRPMPDASNRALCGVPLSVCQEPYRTARNHIETDVWPRLILYLLRTFINLSNVRVWPEVHT